jgi:hypothetical protein
MIQARAGIFTVGTVGVYSPVVEIIISFIPVRDISLQWKICYNNITI